MPVKFQVINVETGKVVVDNLASGKDAKTISDQFMFKTRVVRVVSEDADDVPEWHKREIARFESGEYTPLPDFITSQDWWRNRSPEAKAHFARMSQAKDGMIAFIPDAAYGIVERYLRMAPTKYLARAFPDLPPHVIRDLAIRMQPEGEYKLVLSYKREDFIFAYSGQDVCADGSSYQSCMRYTPDYWRVDTHPAAAYSTFQGEYGSPDAPKDAIAVAYIVDPENAKRVLSRCLVIPSRQHYVRIYAVTNSCDSSSVIEHDRMKSMLTNAGFVWNKDLAGMRISIVEVNSNRVLMPYIDGETQRIFRAEDDPKTLVIGRHHPASTGDCFCVADSTGGTVYSDSGENAEDRFTCDNCGDEYDQEEMNTVQDDVWCDHCTRTHAIFCEYNQEYYPRDCGYEHVHTDASRINRTLVWSRGAVDDYAFYCDRTDAYYAEQEFTSIEVHYDLAHPTWTQTWCAEATEGDYFECPDCGDYFATEFTGEHTNHHGQIVCVHCSEEYEEDQTPAPTEIGPIADERQQEMSV